MNSFRGARANAAGFLVTLAGLLGVVAFAPATASAGYYCGLLTGAYTQCSANSGGDRWVVNTAIYNGTGTVGLCSKYTYTNGAFYSRLCGDGYVSNISWAEAAYGTYLVGFVGNNSPYAHTIIGLTEPYVTARSPGPTKEPGGTVDSIPLAVREKLAVLSTDSGRAAATALTLPGDEVEVRATSERLCLSSTGGSFSTCRSTKDAVDNVLPRAVVICSPKTPADQIVVYGLAPDGATATRIVAPDGRVLAEAPITRNAYRIALDKANVVGGSTIDWVGVKGSSTLDSLTGADLSC